MVKNHLLNRLLKTNKKNLSNFNNNFMKFNLTTAQIFKLLFVCVLLIGLVNNASAQPGFDDDVNDVPVDGGLSLLVAAGVGYGAKKIREKRKKNII